MEAENYLEIGFQTRNAIESKTSGWTRLADVARVWQPSRLKGIQVDPEFGTPFLAATQVYDVRPVPRKWLSLNRTDDYSSRFVNEGTILLTCSGSIGRATLAHSSIKSILISHDLLRIDSIDPDISGWIYAYLRAPSIREMMKTAQYGNVIKHLETQHLDALPIIQPDRELQESCKKNAKAIIVARDRANCLEFEAEAKYQSAFGVPVEQGEDTNGFQVQASVMFDQGRRIEGYYHKPSTRSIEETIKNGAVRLETVANLTERVFVPGRFKHIYGDEGTPYLDSAQILETAPDIDKKVLSLKKQNNYLVDAGTLLIPCSGHLYGIIGSVVLATKWHEGKVLTNHILRIVPKQKATIRVGYLQMVLGHPHLGRPRILKGAYGSCVPELSLDEVNNLSVPRLKPKLEESIADALEEAAQLRAEANEIEVRIATEAENYINRYLGSGL